MKLALEEARAHPNRTTENQTISTNKKSLAIVHDKKLTFSLETYIQWFNRLTFLLQQKLSNILNDVYVCDLFIISSRQLTNVFVYEISIQ